MASWNIDWICVKQFITAILLTVGTGKPMPVYNCTKLDLPITGDPVPTFTPLPFTNYSDSSFKISYASTTFTTLHLTTTTTEITSASSISTLQPTTISNIITSTSTSQPTIISYIITSTRIPSAFESSIIIGELSAAQILAAAPSSASCATPMFAANECVTAADAAPLINKAFQTYGFNTLGQKAALLGLMSLESVDFQANINHYPEPGRPGQGTKAMVMFNYIYEYAYAQPELQDQVLQLSGGQKLEGLTANNISSVPDSTQSQIRALVLPNQYTFGSAPWYLASSSDCPTGTAASLSNSGYSGFTSYVSQCVGAGEATSDRLAKWCAAVNALKPPGMSSPSECS
ncbi:hypothetical protein RUND412_005869 [Rhizina undulata]